MFTYPFSFIGGGNGTQEAATLFLNGVDQYAVVDNSEALGNSDEGTISAWVNLSSLSTNGGRMAFVSKRKNGLELSWQLGYRESGNLFEFIVYHSNGSTSVSSVSSPVVGEWYHVAGVYDESNVKLYIDGTNIETTSIGGVFNSSSALIKVGAEGDVSPGDLYNGSIAIPLVFNVAKTDAEVLDLATARNPGNYSQAGMQVGIPLNTSVLTPEENTISSNGDATLFGSPTYTGELLPLDTIPQVSGPSTGSLNSSVLNGTSQYFTGGDVLDALTDDLSVMVWFKTTTTSVSIIMGKLGTNSNNLWQLATRPGGELQFGLTINAGGNTLLERTTNTFNDGNWHQFIGFIDRSGDDVIIYVDGVLQSTTIVDDAGVITASQDNGFDFRIGARDNTGSELWFDGELAFAGVSIGSDLTADATELYNGGDALCWGAISPATQAKITSFWDISNWDGNTGSEIIDRSGSNDLTNVGSIAYTGSGLDVEC